MDRRTTLAIVLCFLIYMGWQKFYLEPRLPHSTQTTEQAPPQTAAQATSTTTPPATTAAGISAASKEAQTGRPPQTLSIETGTGEAVVTDTAQIFSGWKLKNYRQGLGVDSGPVDLQSVTHQASEVELAFDDSAYAYLSSVQGSIQKLNTGAVEWRFEDANIKLSRTITAARDQNHATVQLSADFKGKHPNFAFVSVTLPFISGDTEERDRQLVYFTDNSTERVSPKEASLKQISTPVRYIGATSRYFLLSVLNESPISATGLIQPIGNNLARVSLVFPVTGNSVSIPLKVYFGPKELNTLRSVDPTLDHTVDFGFFTIFAYPILRFLKWLYSFVGNFGVAIIILTLTLKLATYPLTYKSMKSMKEMAKLQPQLAKIREKYKDDKEALNRETLQVMRGGGYNPVAGCAPMLIQLPIFWALYRVLYSSIDLYQAPFFGYIHDLSAKDPYYVTPVLLSLTMFIQQKLTPNTATDPAQQKMMQLMPLVFGAFMLTLPSGLTIYMLANALASIVQQMILNKKFDTHHAPVLARAR